MAGLSPLYLVNDDLKVATLRDSLRAASYERVVQAEPVFRPAIDPVLPLSADGTLAAGVVYPASDGSARVFALPSYVARVAEGRYLTSLKWVAGGPQEPIARLVVALDRQMPATPVGAALSEISHTATARLAYRVVVQAAGSEAGSAPLAIELGAVVAAADGGSEVVFDVHTKAEFDRLWSALTDSRAEGRLELRCFATLGHRTWRQAVSMTIDPAVLAKLAITKGARRARVVEPVGVVPERSLELRRGNIQPLAVVADASAPHPSHASMLQASSMWLRPDVAGLRPRPVVEAVLPDAPGLIRDDVIGEPIVRWRRTLPRDVFIDPTGTPLPLPVAAEALQSIAFNFDPTINAYMFDVPGDLRPTVTHVLLRCEFDAGGGRAPAVYYQDSAFQSRYYYEPQEFRVPRDETPPYLPSLKLVFDVADEAESAGDADGYSVRMAYRAVPHLDRVVLQRLQRQLRASDPAAQISGLVPETLALNLRLPGASAGATLETSARTTATVDFDDGIFDEIDLTPDALAAVVTLLQIGGVDGEVNASLPGTATTVPVRLSLGETTGLAIDRAFQGPTDTGLVRVRVRNRLESPITIATLFATPLDGGIAYPTATPGVRLAAGESIDLDYRVEYSGEPPALPLEDLDPLLEVVVEPDLAALLPKVMFNKGYSSETFDVALSIDPLYFGQTLPGGAEPLAAVRVEFEDGLEVILDPGMSSGVAHLRLAILEWLLKRPNAARYCYRVVNLHGTTPFTEGAVGLWIDGEGTGALAVTPAGL